MPQTKSNDTGRSTGGMAVNKAQNTRKRKELKARAQAAANGNVKAIASDAKREQQGKNQGDNKGKQTRREALSHDEIWDDRALIESWEGAFEEYKYYHSLHAREEQVEAILDAAEAGEDEAEDDEPAPFPQDEELDSRSAKRTRLSDNYDTHPSSRLPQEQAQAQALPQQPMTPESILGQPGPALHGRGMSTADAQKALMMSWYWAGYYTGIVEGRAGAGGDVRGITTAEAVPAADQGGIGEDVAGSEDGEIEVDDGG